MSVGLGQSKSDVDTAAFQVAMGLEQAFTRARNLQAYIQETGATALQALGYSGSEVSTLTSAINDAVTLANIYDGSAAQGTTAYDFRTFLKLVDGTRFW